MLTVLIASRNGAKKLAVVLPAYCQLAAPDGGWKFVIVDNGSTDDTKSVVTSFASRLPLTCVSEPAPGKNAALNRGLEYAEGDLIVFSDDDAIPKADWLTQARRAADENPRFAIFGGAIRPRWPGTPPAWILNWVQLGPTFTVTPPHLQSGPTTPSSVFGPNMMVRRSVFDAGHRFSVSIGPRGTSYAMGSETEFVRRMVDAGFTCWFSAAMDVEHLIDPKQLTHSWILGRAERFGRGQYRLEFGKALAPPAHVLGVPRFLIRQIAESTLRAAWWTVAFNARERFSALWQLHFYWGQFVEARAMRVREP